MSRPITVMPGDADLAPLFTNRDQLFEILGRPAVRGDLNLCAFRYFLSRFAFKPYVKLGTASPGIASRTPR